MPDKQEGGKEMGEEQIDIINAQNQGIQCAEAVDQAIQSDDPEEIREHILAAIGFGQNVTDTLETAMEEVEEPELADRLEEGMHHMYAAMDQADQALEAGEDEVIDLLVEVRKHVQQSLDYINQVVGVV